MFRRKHLPAGRRTPNQRSILAACGGAMVVLVVGLSSIAAQPAHAVAERFPSDSGEILVRPVQQMSVVIETPEGVIYTDPTGGADRYAEHPAPDLILVSHEHHEHYDASTLAELAGPETRIVVPPYVMDLLPESLKDSAVSLANGEAAEIGAIAVEAIAAYGLGGQAGQWHPRGRGNGYVVTVDGRRLYVAGSTEAVPEMLALRDIDVAFLPLYPPYALGPEDAVDAISVMRPASVYIYQYNSTRTRDDFLVRIGGTAMQTRIVAPDIN